MTETVRKEAVSGSKNEWWNDIVRYHIEYNGQEFIIRESDVADLMDVLKELGEYESGRQNQSGNERILGC